MGEKIDKLMDGINWLVAMRDLNAYARYLIFDEKEETFFTPFVELCRKGMEDYANKHPSKDIFIKGVYCNDDWECLANGLVYASNNFDYSKLSVKIPEHFLPTFKYLIVDRWCDMFPCWLNYFVWNVNTCSYHKIFEYIYDNKNELFGGMTCFT